MKQIGLVLTVLALTVVSTGARADSASAARKAIQARYDRMNRAVMHRDIKGVEDAFAPEAVLKQEGERRSIGREKFLKQAKGIFSITKVLHASTRIVSIKADKDGYETVAEWTGESTFTTPQYTEKGEQPKPRKVSQTVRDTWKKTDKGWQIVQRIID